jgi:hypothetical protein
MISLIPLSLGIFKAKEKKLIKINKVGCLLAPLDKCQNLNFALTPFDSIINWKICRSQIEEAPSFSGANKCSDNL